MYKSRWILLAMIGFFCVACTSNPSSTVTPTIKATALIPSSPTNVVPIDVSVLRDYATFNTPYKQVLFWTGQNNFPNSRDNFYKAKKAWDTFFKKYKDSTPPAFTNSIAWTKNIAAMNSAVLESSKLITTKKLTEAHEQLEIIRRTWFAFRKENAFLDYADSLFSFHALMEDLLKSPEKEVFAEKIAELQILAQALEKNSPQTMTEDDQREFKQLTLALHAAIEETTGAIQQGIAFEECLKKAEAIKAVYSKLYLRFG